jgi:Tfp pilus assembly protein PilV
MKRSAHGFSVVELLVAMAVMTTCLTAMLSLVVTGQSIARLQPEAADQQQRARTARQAIGDALARAGAGLDRGPRAGPLDSFFAPVARSIEGGLTVWSVTGATAQGTLALPLGPVSTTADIVAEATCPAGQSACAFSADTSAIVFDSTGCHEAVRIDDVLPSVLVLRPATRACAFGGGAAIAAGEARTYFVDTSAKQLLRRDEATGTTLPLVDNVAAMDVEVTDGGRQVRVSLRFVSLVAQVPDFVLTFAAAPPNLHGPR